MSFETPTYPGIDVNENLGPRLVGVGIAFTVTTAVTVLLRFISRTMRRISLERDDWLLLAAAVFCWAYNAVIIVEAVHHYYGQHIGKSSAYHLEEFLKGLYSLAIVYPAALTLSKLSLLALYWRLFRNSNVKRPIQIAVALNISWMIAAIFVGIFSCNPVRGFWDVSIQSKCIQEYDFFLANECLTIALDLVVLLIPLWCIAQIQRSLSQKISIGGTFALGLGVTAISAVRLWQLVLAERRPGFDPTFNEEPAGLWAVVEINVWIIVASIPALRPLVLEFFKKSRALSTRITSTYTSSAPTVEEKTIRTANTAGTRRTQWFEATRWNISSQQSPDVSRLSSDHASNSDRGYGHADDGMGNAPAGVTWTPLNAGSEVNRSSTGM